jgi:hypothetical protein
MATKESSPKATRVSSNIPHNFGKYVRSVFGGLRVACWPLVPKFAGSNPAEAVGIFRAKKFLSTTSFGGEVKPSVQCRRFAARKRSLK